MSLARCAHDKNSSKSFLRADASLNLAPKSTLSDYGKLLLKDAIAARQSFDDPIPLPLGRQIVTPEDAGAYIAELPKAE